MGIGGRYDLLIQHFEEEQKRGINSHSCGTDSHEGKDKTMVSTLLSYTDKDSKHFPPLELLSP